MTKTRTAILIHGCHLQTDFHGKTWEDIVWGVDARGNPTLTGKAARGIKAAIEYDAELLIFSSGASERDGVKEGAFTRRDALARVDAITQLIGGVSSEEVTRYLTERSLSETKSENTRDEIRLAFERCSVSGIERIILVSSPWHMPRCILEAADLAEEARNANHAVPEFLGMPSYGPTEGILVMEWPTRGDGQKHHGPDIGRRLLDALNHGSDVEAIEKDVVAAIDRHYPAKTASGVHNI